MGNIDSRLVPPALQGAATLLRHWRIVWLKLPQWRTWCLAMLAWAWLLLVQQSGRNGLQDFCTTSSRPGDKQELISALLIAIPGWLLMVTAMMLPLLNEPVRHVAFSHPRWRQHRACFMFTMAYLAFWLCNGIVLLSIRHGLDHIIPNPVSSTNLLASAAFALAAARVWSDARQRSMMACGRTMPLRISGWRADRDCAMYGIATGWTCACNCQLPMLGLMLAGHGIGLMVVCSLILLVERQFLPHQNRLPGYAWCGLALFFLWRSF